VPRVGMKNKHKFLRREETCLIGDRMKTAVAVVYLLFGVFFLFAGISMLGISSTVQPYYSHGVIDPVFVLAVAGLTVVAVSLLFLVLTLYFFRAELFGEQS